MRRRAVLVGMLATPFLHSEDLWTRELKRHDCTWSGYVLRNGERVARVSGTQGYVLAVTSAMVERRSLDVADVIRERRAQRASPLG